MSDKKKKAAAVAAVKVIVNSVVPKESMPLSTNDSWSQWGRQSIMINRDRVQLRVKN